MIVLAGCICSVSVCVLLLGDGHWAFVVVLILEYMCSCLYESSCHVVCCCRCCVSILVVVYNILVWLCVFSAFVSELFYFGVCYVMVLLFRP